MVPLRQIAKVEVMTPGNAVERVVGTHDVALQPLRGSIGTGAQIGIGAQQETRQSKGADRARSAQFYRCKPDSKGTKLTVPSD
jgi:hypothetical protein